MQTIKPAGVQIFCKPDPIETTTKSGFYIPTNTAERPKTATIISTGDSVKTFKKGDRVIFRSYATTEFKLDGEDYFLVEEQDVLGTLIDANTTN